MVNNSSQNVSTYTSAICITDKQLFLFDYDTGTGNRNNGGNDYGFQLLLNLEKLGYDSQKK